MMASKIVFRDSHSYTMVNFFPSNVLPTLADQIPNAYTAKTPVSDKKSQIFPSINNKKPKRSKRHGVPEKITEKW